MSSFQYFELQEELQVDKNGKVRFEKVIDFLSKVGIPTFDESGGRRLLPSQEERDDDEEDTRPGSSLSKIVAVSSTHPPSKFRTIVLLSLTSFSLSSRRRQ